MYDVIVVGAGVAGLVCALESRRRGLSALVLEGSDQVGGRIRSDRVDGFTLDRGFQVLLTAYPEARSYLDYQKLRLRNFEPGALVRFEGKFHLVADPRRVPSAAMESTFAAIGTFADKLRVVRLAATLQRKSLHDIANSKESSTLAYLREEGFSEKIINRFFRPFLGGIYLEKELATSSRKFEFVFKMFAQGFAAVPESGMHELPRQLAAKLPDDVVRGDSPVASVSEDHVELQDGELVPARAVVLATDIVCASRLLSIPYEPSTLSTACMYFSADHAPADKAILILNGDGDGPVNHVVVMSNVCPAYAPKGKALISVNVVGLPPAGNPEELVRKQLTDWFGNQVESWSLLRTYEIKNALPFRVPGARSEANSGRIILAGDYLDDPSTNAAMAAGRRAAEQVGARLGCNADLVEDNAAS